MAKAKTLFVQIASYRDPECAATIADLFAKASNPSRINLGICWQYKAGEDTQAPAIAPEWRQHVRVHAVSAGQSEGPSWAKHQAQQLYKNEEYVLMIDSHMRFVQDWDEILLQQLADCATPKAVLSHLPPGYTPPDKVEAGGKLTVIRPHYPNEAGDIRMRGEQLDRAPKKPLRGAFAAPGFLFAPAAVLAEVPYDPYLYFEQEELCLAARLFTHGWDVYHPSKVIAYHFYDSAPVAFARHKHWDDNAWIEFHRRGRERSDHLLGVQVATSDGALAELDRYGHGDARTLDEFAAFCGIRFAKREVSDYALTCGFIPSLNQYRDTKLSAPPKPTAAPAAEQIQPSTVSSRKPLPTLYSMQGVENFKPASTDILRIPLTLPPGVKKEKGERDPKPRIITKGIPPGVLVIENFAPPRLCRYLCAQADSIAGQQLTVVDEERSTGSTVVTKMSEGRITEYVTINPVAADMGTLFNDIYWHRLALYYGVTFEWYERPQILRYPVGGKYNPHADAEHLSEKTNIWMRSLDRDISVLLYLNEDYEGGALHFGHFDYTLQPKTGMLLAFPSDHRYLHAALPTTKGIRYVIVSWASTVGSPRVKDQPPYASTIFHLPA